MSKRLTITDYLFTLMFIFMLICIVGAFFYGVQVGKKQAAGKYEQLLQDQLEEPASEIGYHQQDLVSFYHTVFLPNREFQKKWFETMRSFEQHSNTSKPSALLKELAALADQQYKEIKKIQVSDVSPLLVSAHTQYIQSLKLFADKAGELKPGNLAGLELMTMIEQDAYIEEAKQMALQAQANFFDAIVKWNETTEHLNEAALIDEAVLELNEWSKLNLNLKNAYIANLLQAQQQFGNYYPQDVVIRIDELILTGQAKQMKLQDIPKIAQTLIQTRAIRYGDFLESKSSFYEQETLPQLPFFYAQD